MTRLERLRRMQRQLEDGYPDASATELLAVALPSWRIVEYLGRPGQPMWRIADSDDDSIVVANPLASVGVALWLATEALPGHELITWARPEGCEQKCHIAGATGVAKTMPWAICSAVVAALIAVEEREAVG